MIWPRLLNTIDLSSADRVLMRSSFVDPVLSSYVHGFPFTHDLFRQSFAPAALPAFLTTMTNLATHNPFFELYISALVFSIPAPCNNTKCTLGLGHCGSFY